MHHEPFRVAMAEPYCQPFYWPPVRFGGGSFDCKSGTAGATCALGAGGRALAKVGLGLSLSAGAGRTGIDGGSGAMLLASAILSAPRSIRRGLRRRLR